MGRSTTLAGALSVALLTSATPGNTATIIYQEHFNAATLPAAWQNGAERFPGYPHLETRAGNGEFEQYIPGQVDLWYGRLRLTARRMTNTERNSWLQRIRDPKFGYINGDPKIFANLYAVNWVSGQFSSYPATPFAPGTKMTIRAQMPVSPAAFVGLWAYDYANYTEIDVVENNGRNASDSLGNTQQTIHDHKADPALHQSCGKRSYAPGYHDYAADWTNPRVVTFSIDGSTTCAITVGPRMTKPMAIILNLAVGSSGWPWIGVPTASTPGMTALIDWVKVEKP